MADTVSFYLASSKATLPSKANEDDAGFDLYACIDEPIEVPSGGRKLIDTKVHLALPKGHYGRVAPRSGLAVKHGIDVGAGVVDEPYRDSIRVLLFNFNDQSYTVQHGDRIAQLIVTPYASPKVVQVSSVDALGSTSRGRNGFGSSGR